SCQELGGASSAPTPCSPCASPVSTATGTPIGASAAKTARPQIKTAPPYHKNPQHDCITLDRTLIGPTRGPVRVGVHDRLDAEAQVVVDAVGGADPNRADGLHGPWAREDGIDVVERAERAETGRAGEVDAGDHVGRQLPHLIADDRRAAGIGGPGELREAVRARPQEGLVAARGPDPDDDAVVERMVVAEVALASDPTLDALAAPGRDPRADVEPRPWIPPGFARARRQRGIARRRVGQIGGESGSGLQDDGCGTGGRDGAGANGDGHVKSSSMRLASSGMPGRVRRIHGGPPATPAAPARRSRLTQDSASKK